MNVAKKNILHRMLWTYGMDQSSFLHQAGYMPTEKKKSVKKKVSKTEMTVSKRMAVGYTATSLSQQLQGFSPLPSKVIDSIR